MGRRPLWETWTGSVSPLLCGFPDRGVRRGEFNNRVRRARSDRDWGSGVRGSGVRGQREYDDRFDAAVSGLHTEVALKVLRGGVVMLAYARVNTGVIQITGAGGKEPQNGAQLSGGTWVVRLVPEVWTARFFRRIVEIGSRWRIGGETRHAYRYC